jgi:hypothetical protein
MFNRIEYYRETVMPASYILYLFFIVLRIKNLKNVFSMRLEAITRSAQNAICVYAYGVMSENWVDMTLHG